LRSGEGHASRLVELASVVSRSRGDCAGDGQGAVNSVAVPTEVVTLCILPARVNSIKYIIRSILLVCLSSTLFCLARGPSGADRRRITSFVVFVDILITVSLMSAMHASKLLRRLSKSAEAAAHFCSIPEMSEESR
jgi:hypothetical protein